MAQGASGRFSQAWFPLIVTERGSAPPRGVHGRECSSPHHPQSRLQQRKALDRQAETVDRFARLQEFFATVKDDGEFLDTAEMLHATVHHVTLSVNAGGATSPWN